MPHGMDVILFTNNLRYYLKLIPMNLNTYCFVLTLQIYDCLRTQTIKMTVFDTKSRYF